MSVCVSVCVCMCVSLCVCVCVCMCVCEISTIHKYFVDFHEVRVNERNGTGGDYVYEEYIRFMC